MIPPYLRVVGRYPRNVTKEIRMYQVPVGEDVEIFVPSRSRSARSLTLEALTYGGLAQRTTLVVPYSQGQAYLPLARKHKVKQLLRCKEDGIAATRKLCGERAANKFIMIDDDLRFYRRKPNDVILYKFDKNDMAGMLILVSRMLDLYAHVAISAREGNNRLDFPYVTCSRPLRALAYRKKEFDACVHGRVAIMEDFDVTLQLIKRGYENAVITEYSQVQPVTQAYGGCSDYRTKELHEKNVKLMAKLHPGIIKLRQKENKTGGDFGSRLEATIYWQKAHTLTMKDIL